jgi:DisA bacterial checkpoint controller nucleotide-binding
MSEFKLPSNSKLRRALGDEGATFLEYGVNSITRILPHTEMVGWKISRVLKTSVRWSSQARRELKVVLSVRIETESYSVEGAVQRKRTPEGVGAILRTLDNREKDICENIVKKLEEIIGPPSLTGAESLAAIKGSFDERVVAAHLKAEHNLKLNPGSLFQQLRLLAGQTYENKPLTFGCLIDSDRLEVPSKGAAFPESYLTRKRYRALSDGYYSSYLVSQAGRLIAFCSLASEAHSSTGGSYSPDWCEDLANNSRKARIGVCLTRHGDLLVFERGSLRFTCRFGQWQYWNHAHLVDLLHSLARVQKTPKSTTRKVVRSVYRAALDVSFRRSGGLFIVLRDKRRLHDFVRPGDALSDAKRLPVDNDFDQSLPSKSILTIPRNLTVELAALDGAIVLSNEGNLLAYAAVLAPKKRGSVSKEEGSRTKAAIGSSKYGLAIKVSSDGDISIYAKGKKFIQI